MNEISTHMHISQAKNLPHFCMCHYGHTFTGKVYLFSQHISGIWFTCCTLKGYRRSQSPFRTHCYELAIEWIQHTCCLVVITMIAAICVFMVAAICVFMVATICVFVVAAIIIVFFWWF